MTDETVPEATDRAFGFLDLIFVTSIFAVLGAIAIPRVLEERRHGNEAHAIGALKAIATSEAIFREGDKERDENLDYGMLSELEKTGLVGAELGTGTRSGYLFQVAYGFSTSEFLWFAVANPEVPGFSGTRFFDTNQAGVIFYTTSGTIALDTNTCILPNNGDGWGGSK